ncbi:hypothetical protein ACFYQQ_20615 [Streptomyces sp. NPDC005496]|uniref:hypothetical protein n=1 Tax=Streptomyces sp. NPDC005496 TaxID=3364716 RepID=UPI003679B58F
MPPFPRFSLAADPAPENVRSSRPRTTRPLGRTAAALLFALSPRGRGTRRRPADADRPRTDPRHRLARDLDNCRQERDRWRRHADSYEQELTLVSQERTHLLAWLAALHPSTAVITPATRSQAHGTYLLWLVAGGRQLSWQLSLTDLSLFTHVPYSEWTADTSPDDTHSPWDQATHIRRHTHLLTFEASLLSIPGPAEGRPHEEPGPN